MEIQEALLRVLIHGMVREGQAHRDHPLQKEAFDLVFPVEASPTSTPTPVGGIPAEPKKSAPAGRN